MGASERTGRDCVLFREDDGSAVTFVNGSLLYSRLIPVSHSSRGMILVIVVVIQ